MATEFKLPDLGEGVESGDVLRVLVSVGDSVRKEQPVIEVETGKAVVEVPSSVEGRVLDVQVAEGDTVQVGQSILTVEEVGGGEQVKSAPEQQAMATEAMATADEPAGVTADEVSPPRGDEMGPSPAGPEGTAVPSAPREAPEGEPGLSAAPSPIRTGDGREGAPPRPVMAAPSVRQFAREVGVDIREVRGSGPGGRISEEDVKAHVRELLSRSPAAISAAVTPPAIAEAAIKTPLPDFEAFGPVEREPMSNVRIATAEQMARAWSTVPHVTQFDTADMTEMELLRQRYQARVESAGGKLTITAILVKLAAAALKRFPQFSASLDLPRREIVIKRYYHIGVAVDTERGLLVPVVRDADRKSLAEIAVELGELSARARERKLRPEEMQGGCFTISNLGGLGGKHFAPIVNYPEVAILGIGRATTQPAYVDGELQPRLMLPVALSYDHRLIDGADGTRFLRWVVEAIEQPFLVSLEG